MDKLEWVPLITSWNLLIDMFILFVVIYISMKIGKK